MTTLRVSKTNPIERTSLNRRTSDNVGTAWSTACALCSTKLARDQVRQIGLRRVSGGRSGLNVCATCADMHRAKRT